MQRYHRVHEIDVQPSGHRTQDDLLPALGQMSFVDCTEERRRLLHEKQRAEQDLIAAKRFRDVHMIDAIGLRIQGLCNRLGQVNARIKEFRGNAEYQAFKQAVCEVLDPETWQLVIDRKEEIRRASLAGEAT
jgi:hypothetical protein